MQIDFPDNIQESEGYLGHEFSVIDAYVDLHFLRARGVSLSIRKLALRWQWKKTRTEEFTKSWRTLGGHLADSSISENQEVTPKTRTLGGHLADKLSAEQEKENNPPNNIYNNPLNKEKEKSPYISKENPPLKEALLFPAEVVQHPVAPPCPPQKKFVPPTIPEIEAYAREKGISEWVDAEQFWNFYDMKNWYVGKNKMVRWRSAVSGWAARQKEQPNINNNGRTTNKQTEAEEREQWLKDRLLRKYKDQMADFVADGSEPFKLL